MKGCLPFTRIAKEAKLDSLSLPDQVVCDKRREGLETSAPKVSKIDKSEIRYPRLPNGLI